MNHTKNSRKKYNLNHWINVWMPKFSQMYDISEHVSGGYTLETQEYGIVDYYPKSNKVLIRKDNEWISNGLDWMIKELYIKPNK